MSVLTLTVDCVDAAEMQRPRRTVNTNTRPDVIIEYPRGSVEVRVPKTLVNEWFTHNKSELKADTAKSVYV